MIQVNSIGYQLLLTEAGIAESNELMRARGPFVITSSFSKEETIRSIIIR